MDCGNDLCADFEARELSALIRVSVLEPAEPAAIVAILTCPGPPAPYILMC